MEKRKKYLYISIGFITALAIIVVMGMQKNTNTVKIEEMEQLCREVLPYTSLSGQSRSISRFSYQGIVESSDEQNAGLAKFNNGTFNYYVDSAFEQLRKVESISDFDFDSVPLAENEITDASDQLFLTASGQDIFSGCVKNVSPSDDKLSFTIDYIYLKDTIEVPAASITYLYDGTLFYAYFYNMDVLNQPDLQSAGTTAITEDEAIAIAEETAEEFISYKSGEYAERYVLDTTSVTCSKWYSRKENRDCWRVCMSYRMPDVEVPFYFEIFLDMYTGEVIYNANNYT